MSQGLKLSNDVKYNDKSSGAPAGSDCAQPDTGAGRGSVLQRFQRIINGNSYGMWDLSLDDDRVYLFGRFWDKLSHNPEGAAASLAMPEVRHRFHADDWEAFAAQIQQIIAGVSDTVSLEVRFLNIDGVYVWTQVDGQVERDAQGRASFISGLTFEIDRLKQTESLLRESEERHARILSATSDGIWEWSGHSGDFHFSSRCWEHLGYSEHDDEMLDGRNRLEVWRERIHPEDIADFDGQMFRHLKNEGPFDIEYRIAGKDGACRWIRARGQASYNEQGHAVRMSGTNMDITTLKEAEARVVAAKEQAEKANLAKSEFLSSMSHELRTPLNAILGYTQLFALEKSLTESQRENIGEIHRAGEHLLQLISDVLDLSKIESGRMTLSVEPVMPMRIVTECIKLIRPLVESRQVRLWATPNGLEDLCVHADATRLKQALLNLMANAVKYNHIGGDVELTFSQNDEDGFCIEVRDTGPGIPLERQAEVFEPFNRLGAEGSAIEGSGVGLVITKRLVNMMGGELTFRSREGQGSRFWITLPNALQSTLPTPAELPTPAVGQMLRLDGRKRILYIEDNPPNIRLMEQMIKHFSQLELIAAKEAFYGVYLARTEHPDLIILDINLPGMDGYEALSVLKQDRSTRNIPVVALSANAMPYDLERGRKAGFEEYLTKPLQLEQLLTTLNRLLALTEQPIELGEGG